MKTKSTGKISGKYLTEMEELKNLRLECDKSHATLYQERLQWSKDEQMLRDACLKFEATQRATILRLNEAESQAMAAHNDVRRLTKSLTVAETKLQAVTLHLEYEDAHRAILDRHLGLSEVPVPKHLMDPKLLNKLDEKTQTTILTEVYRQKANGGQA